MLNEKLAWKEESDECKKIRSIFNFAWSFLKCKRLSLYYSTFEASMMIFIMEIRREFSLFHIEPKSLCSVADYARKFKWFLFSIIHRGNSKNFVQSAS